MERDDEAIVWDGGGRPVAVGSRGNLAWDALGRPCLGRWTAPVQRRLFGGRVRGAPRASRSAIEPRRHRPRPLRAHRYRHLDFRGNVKLVSDARDASSSMRDTRRTVRTGSKARPIPRRASPRAAASASSSLLGARLYDPHAGRFLAPDPIFQLVNQYAYAGGNPVWYWDPDGRSAQVAAAFAHRRGRSAPRAPAAIIGAPAVTILAFAFSNGLATPPNAIATIGEAPSRGWAMPGGSPP